MPTAEQELILTAAVGPDTSSIEAFEQWNESTDFQKKFDCGILRLLPLVYRWMHAPGIVAPTMPMLKGAYRHVWYDTQSPLHGVAPALSLFQANKIEMVLLKGAPLLDVYYNGFGLRPMNDTDVVLRWKDVRKAVSLLEEAGWNGSRLVEFCDADSGVGSQ